jgi:hypothetical protein
MEIPEGIDLTAPGAGAHPATLECVNDDCGSSGVHVVVEQFEGFGQCGDCGGPLAEIKEKP